MDSESEFEQEYVVSPLRSIFPPSLTTTFFHTDHGASAVRPLSRTNRISSNFIHSSIHLVILLEGLRLMRPEKSWRPIVTLEIDNFATHESILGVDGQSVNQKEAFRL